jgi:hypothetical protein
VDEEEATNLAQVCMSHSSNNTQVSVTTQHMVVCGVAQNSNTRGGTLSTHTCLIS